MTGLSQASRSPISDVRTHSAAYKLLEAAAVSVTCKERVRAPPLGIEKQRLEEIERDLQKLYTRETELEKEVNK